jgi:uncharacterized protein (TIGR02466 family)
MTPNAASEFPNSQSVALAFPTLIGKFELQNTSHINTALERLILEKERSTPSRDHANHGGWHSPADLLYWPGEEIETLKRWMSEGLSRMVQATLQLPEVQSRAERPQGSFRISAWANVARRGNYHRMHNHPLNAWSGCYYVCSGPPTLLPDGKPALAGALEFYDPRPFTEMVDVPGTPYGQRIIIRPQPGLLVLFPSWLYHFVHPTESDSPRISIAFNASWIPTQPNS